MWTWHFRTSFNGHCGLRWKVGLDDLDGFFQPNESFDSMMEKVPADLLQGKAESCWAPASLAVCFGSRECLNHSLISSSYPEKGEEIAHVEGGCRILAARAEPQLT